jgi:DNA-directed RNA polymerase subunit RPC12/RpoP
MIMADKTILRLKQVASFDNYVLANMTLGLLQENEIDCHLKDENIITIDPLLSPAIGGIKLMVLEQDYDRAKEMIQQAEADYLSGICCPYCHNKGLHAEEKTTVPTTLLGYLKNRIFYGQPAMYSKKYRCNHCSSLFTDIPLVNENE